MNKVKEAACYFNRGEWLLWSGSVFLIAGSFFLLGGTHLLILAASLIGATSLIFNAKGNPAGQLLMVIFSVLYGVISFSFSYYGEMITYLGMTGPMAVAALISWLRNPYEGNRAQVRVGSLGRGEGAVLIVATVIATVAFYYILAFFHTANLTLSTVSVATSFLAAYLTYKRSPYFALAYAANDVVLIGLWILAAASDAMYGAVAICFFMFLINDLYGFVCWSKMRKCQQCETAG